MTSPELETAWLAAVSGRRRGKDLRVLDARGRVCLSGFAKVCLPELGEVGGFRGRSRRWQTGSGRRMEEGGTTRHRRSEASRGRRHEAVWPTLETGVGGRRLISSVEICRLRSRCPPFKDDSVRGAKSPTMLDEPFF
jgi:hypothetical protein